MQQHPVPQNIMGVEFQLIGSMTIRQFGYVAAGAVIAWLSLTSPLPFFIKWALVIGAGLTGLALAFLPVNDIPLDRWVTIFFNAINSPTKRIWRKESLFLDFLSPTYSAYLEKQTAPPIPAATRLKLDQYLKTLEPQEKKSELDLAEENYLGSLDFSLTPPPPTLSTPAPIEVPVVAPIAVEPAPRSVVEKESEVEVGKIASEVSFKPIVTIQMPDKSVYVKPVSNVRLRSLHRLPTLGGTITLPIRGERVIQLPDFVQKQLQSLATMAALNPKPAPPPPNLSPSKPLVPHVPPKPIFSARKDLPNIVSGEDQYHLEEPNPPRTGGGTVAPLPPTDSDIAAPPRTQSGTTVAEPRSQSGTVAITPAPPHTKEERPPEEVKRISESPFFKPTSETPSSQDQPRLVPVESELNRGQPQFDRGQPPIKEGSPLPSQEKPLSLQPPLSLEEETLESRYPSAFKAGVSTPSPTAKETERAAPPPPTLPIPAAAPEEKPAEEIKFDLDKEILKKQKELLSQQVEELKAKINASQEEKGKIQSQLSQALQETAKAKSSEQDAAKLETVVKDYQTQLERVKVERETLFSQLSSLKNQINAFQETNQKSQAEREEQQKSLAEKEKAVSELKTQLTEMEKEREQALERAAKMQALLDELTKQKAEAEKKKEERAPVAAEDLTIKTQTPVKPMIKVVAPKKAEGKMAPAITSTPNVINGIIKDKNGLLVSDVIIVVKDVDDDPVRALKTNKIGQFAISTPLPNGTYTMELEKDGYEFDIIEIKVAGEILAPIEIRAK
jgi:hypothetical protein